MYLFVRARQCRAPTKEPVMANIGLAIQGKLFAEITTEQETSLDIAKNRIFAQYLSFMGPPCFETTG
jgi:hypothetical protein